MLKGLRTPDPARIDSISEKNLQVIFDSCQQGSDYEL
jgi:hypothetical protein